jgi:hypothetical protein
MGAGVSVSGSAPSYGYLNLAPSGVATPFYAGTLVEFFLEFSFPIS